MPDLDVAIIGGGISGLSGLHFLKKSKPNLSVQLYEADDRLGGTIGTDHNSGYSFDWGPNGFLDREPLTLQLCDELGLNDQLERANDRVSNRYILRKGRLRAVPMSPISFLTSDILSLKGRFRVMTEPFAKGPRPDVDETVYDFVKRRIGREAADYLVQPMVSGVYGGLADRLSLKSTFKIMHEMESEYGSLFKAMIARAKKARKEGRKSGGPSGPGGWLTSFKGGLNAIINRFEVLYGESIRTGCSVENITRSDNQFIITFNNGDSRTARQIILALPAYRAATILYELSQKLSQALESIPYAPIAVVCLGYPREAVAHSLNGFGFLVPRKENRHILGSLWTSSIFDNRAPEGHVQLRTMLGGDGDYQSINLSDDELISRTADDLGEILGVRGEADTTKVYRWSRGIPQFRIGHAVILERIEQEIKAIGNIYVTGNAYYGIGLNDCVVQSKKVVEQIS